MELSDIYNFDIDPSKKDYNNDWFKTSVNNSAVISQLMGVISDYNLSIKITNEIQY